MNREHFGRSYRKVKHAHYAADLRRYYADLTAREEAEVCRVFLCPVRPDPDSGDYPDMDDAPPRSQRFPRSWKNKKKKRQYLHA